jgi:hypothetical protein
MNKVELTEILEMAQEGEAKLKAMSDNGTTISEKWRVRTNASINSDNIHHQDVKIELL